MAHSHSHPGPGAQPDVKSGQFVFACPTVEFATTFTPDNFKTATKRGGGKKKGGKAKSERFASGDCTGDNAASSSNAAGASSSSTPHVPRPPNAFILFRSSFIKGNHVDPHIETNHSTLSKIAGLTWNNLPDDQKAEWHQKAKIARAEHSAKFPDYSFKPVDRPDRTKSRRKVLPKDEVRCAKIAQLLSEGVQGEHLRTEITKFDQQHVMKIETRFEVPVTAKSFKRRRSSAATVTQESAKHEEKRKRRKRSPTVSDSDSAWETETSPPSPAVDPEMPPLRDPPSSFHVFSLAEDSPPPVDFGSFSFSQAPDPNSPPSQGFPYPMDPLSPPQGPTSPSGEEFPHPASSPYLTKPHPSNLHIDTASFSYDMSQLSSTPSAESLPSTPFYDEFTSLDSALPPQDGEYVQEQGYPYLPMEAYDPSSVNGQFDYSSFAPQTEVGQPNMSCYMLDQQQQQQAALVAAASAAWSASWMQHQNPTQRDDSCHAQPAQQPMLTIPLDMANYMMTTLASPYTA